MAKKRSRQGASRPLRRATPNDPPGAQPESYTPADLPDTIPDARRRYALWQAGMLKTKVDAAIESLDWFRKEDDHACTRIDKALRGWELDRDPEKLEREEFFLRLADAAGGAGTADAQAQSLLSMPAVAVRLEQADEATRQRARDITVQLLKTWGAPARHRPGEGQWPCAVALVKLIWRVSLSPKGLRVEHSRALAARRRRGGHPATETLEMIKSAPRLLRPPGRDPTG